MGEARIYATLLRASLAGQASYRASFALELAGQGFVVLLEFAEVFAIFTQVRALGTFSFADVLVVFGLASIAFALADLVVGQVDVVSDRVRAGTFDVILLRPLSALGQLVTADVQLRRFGRVGIALVVLVLGLDRAEVDWTPPRVTLLVVTPLAGAVVFGALFVVSGALSFWLVEGREVGNAFTYGTSYLTEWPLSVFGLAVRRFFTFVIPAAFIAYLPALQILGRPDPTGLPRWLAWSGPLAAAWAAALAGLLWRAGIRHYTGAGG